MTPREPKPAGERSRDTQEGADFKAHLFGGPKFDDFTVSRDPDRGRVIDLDGETP